MMGKSKVAAKVEAVRSRPMKDAALSSPALTPTPMYMREVVEKMQNFPSDILEMILEDMSMEALVTLSRVEGFPAHVHVEIHKRIDELRIAAQAQREKEQAEAEEQRWFPRLDGEMEELCSDWSENEF